MEITIKWSMCRTCMAKQCSTLRPLFESQAVEHLYQYAGLVVKQDDGLPDQICGDCVDKLEQVHRMMCMFRRSDEQLKNLVSKTMSSSASLKTTTVADGSPPIQRKRARKQELSAQTRGLFSDDETAEHLLKSDEESEMQLVPIYESHSTEEESWLVFEDEYIDPDNEFKATSSQGSPIAIHNEADSQEASEEENFAQSSDNAFKDQHNNEICSKTNPNPPQRKSHMRKHLEEKSYECEVCSKRFNAVCNLTSHMRTHTGEKPYQCAYCSRRFADHSSHRKHERIHTNERPYACNICGKAFALSTSRKAHYMTHSSEKPYKCLPCMKSFRLKHQLTAHEKTDAHRMGCAGLAHKSS